MHVSDSPLKVGLAPLTIDDVIAVARYRRMVQPLPTHLDNADELSPIFKRMQVSANWVREVVSQIESENEDKSDALPIYGINTGFGANAGKATFTSQTEVLRLSRNLILSHAAGTGDLLDEEAVRAALLIRVNSLIQGYSGVRVKLVNTLIAMLNAGVFPAIPEQGSLGASGDLAPLAHLALLVSRPPNEADPDPEGHSGSAFLNGELVSGIKAMQAAGIERLVLGPKEALALINGTPFSTAIAVLSLYDATMLVRTSEAALAMSLDALRGYRDAFLPHLHAVRGMPGQQTVAANVYALLRESTLVRGDVNSDLSPEDAPPQDPYSLRAAPQVIGAIRDTLEHVRSVLTREINAVTDNPIIFADEDGALHLPRAVKAISGGNFHGQPIAFAADFLGIAMSSLANIAERRVFLLTDPAHNRGLPAFLSHQSYDAEGIKSGLMIAQYTAASLVSENKTLAHPDSVDSITSSANQEDYVSMSMNAARHARRIVRNAEGVVAIELLTAAQALHLRQHMGDERLGRGVQAAKEAVRNCVPALEADVPLHPYIECLRNAIRNGEVAEAVAEILNSAAN